MGEYPAQLDMLAKDPLVGNLLLPGQAEALYDAASKVPDGGLIVEIGSFLGASTIALGLACLGTSKRVVAIDTFAGNSSDFVRGLANVWWQGNSYFDLFSANLSKFGLSDIVYPVRGNSANVATTWCGDIDLLFIDGDHTDAGARADCINYYPFLKNGGRLMMHDVLPDRPHLQRIWEDLCNHTIAPEANFKGLAVGRKQLNKSGLRWVIIPTFNEIHFLSQLLERLCVDELDADFRLVVVDDAGDEKVLRLVSQFGDSVSYVRGHPNNFWGGAVDSGINSIANVLADSDRIILVNSDSLLTAEELIALDSSCGNFPFGNTGIGFDLVEEGTSRQIANGGNLVFGPRNLGASIIQQRWRRKGNYIRCGAIFGRASIFPAYLFKSYGMRFLETGFNHYWSDTAFCIMARERFQTNFYIDLTYKPLCQANDDNDSLTVRSACKKLFSKSTQYNENLYLLVRFLKKYSNLRSHEIFYFCMLKVITTFCNVRLVAPLAKIFRFVFLRARIKRLFEGG